LVGVALASALACAPERTMLVVRVQSNLDVPDALDTVRVVVKHAGKEIQNLPFPLVNGTHKLPLEVGLLSPSGGGTGVGITVTGVKGQTAVVSEDAVTSFIKGKSLVLEMYLAAECVAFDCNDPTKTCTRGQVCIDRTRPPETLPIFEAEAHPNMDASTTVDAKSDRAEGGAAGGGAGGGGAGGDTDAGADAAGGAGTGGAGTGSGGAGGSGAGGVGGADAGGDASDARIEVAPEVPACVPVTEDCFNGKDDDCDGKPDCADPDCMPTTICVPRPSGTVGVTVDPTVNCPVGFGGGATSLGSGPTAGSACTGCGGCGTGKTDCKANLYTQTTQAACAQNTGGKFVYQMSTLDSDACPIPDTNTTNVYGARLDPWAVSPTCSAGPTGTPVAPKPIFGKAVKFCSSEKMDAAATNGCMAGFVCMPKPATGKSCAMLDAVSQCPAGTNADTLYTGITDARTCSACSCSTAGATCDNIYVKMGSDYSCMNVDTGHIKGGLATCATQQFGVYVPGYEIVGTPTPPSCAPSSTASGTLSPTGGRTVCCLP
jgi:hypothetical protein